MSAIPVIQHFSGTFNQYRKTVRHEKERSNTGIGKEQKTLSAQKKPGKLTNNLLGLTRGFRKVARY